MVSNKSARRYKIIASTSVTALFSAILYVCFLTTPLTFLDAVSVMTEGIVIGMLVFILLGILVRIWTRKLHLVCVGVAIGIMGGGAWIEYWYSGHPHIGIVANSIGIVEGAIYHLTTTWPFVFPFFLSAVISWIITSIIIKRIQSD